MFSKETYMARRAKLKQTIGSGLLLFLGNDESGMNYADNTYHFRQDSTFLYFFGLPYAGLSAIIDIDNDKEIIFGDELTIDAIVWMGTQPTLKEKSEAAGIKEVRPFKEIETYLKNAQQKWPANPLSADVSCGTPDQVIPMVGYRTRCGETFRTFHHGCRKPTEL